MNNYKRLSAGERLTIHEMRRAGETISAIARATNRSAGTISKELNRHRQDQGKRWLRMSGAERAEFAGQRAKRNASRRGRKRSFSNEKLRDFVFEKLSIDNWSPEAIAGRLKLDGVLETVCASTIYNYLQTERGDWIEFLRRRGVPRRKRVCHRRSKFRQAAPSKRSCFERPAAALNREEVGHFEVDTVVSCRGGKGGVLAVRERLTRHREYMIIPDLKAATVLAALRALLMRWPPNYVKSLTFDNGSEFCTTEMMKLETFFKELTIYYTDPYAAWQKGAVENSNGELRWYYPKGTDFSTISQKEMQDTITKLNRKPMKCHGWRSSQELFNKLAA